MTNTRKKLHVCPRCKGYGTIANPSFDGMSTSEMYDEMGYEETHDFLNKYTQRGGMYDIICPCCKGSKVVTKKQIRKWNEEVEYQREVEAEQRMFNMGRY